MESDDMSTSVPDVASSPPEEEKMSWLYVFVIGLGFFTTGVSWSVYNSYLPADFLPAFIVGDLQNTIIGLIMVLDNIFALVMQPYIGARSDKTRTRWGRRMPYIMAGTPIAAAFFTLVAYGWAVFGFWFMFAMLTVFNIAMAFYRAPVVALMPDVVPDKHRTNANGVINLMGGVGAIYAFAIASQIYKINDPGIGAILGVTAAQSGPVLAFLTTSVIMVVAVLVLFVVVKEPETPPVDADQPKEIGIIEAARLVSSLEDKSALAILGAIMFWFFGFNALETWFTKYGNEILGFATADAAFLLTAFSLTFVLFAIPAGFVAGRVGRKNTIAVGLVGLVASLVIAWLLTDYMQLFIVLAFAGIFWAMINVNSIVIVWQHFGQKRLGAGTGLYYFFSMTAAILGPFLTGLFFDITSIALLFPVSILFLVVALALMMSVKTGETGDSAMG
ncbi:MAG: MFS transporter [Candidatus Thorarchaeota archaeon]|nr:MAG: MFS transporter [Candidatus Thorarchaeota archaeon]